MNRRHFLGSPGAASLFRPPSEAVDIEVVRPRSPDEALLRDIEPGPDGLAMRPELDELTCTSEEMVAGEIDVWILAYSLMRAAMRLTAERPGPEPRDFIFTQLRNVLDPFLPRIMAEIQGVSRPPLPERGIRHPRLRCLLGT